MARVGVVAVACLLVVGAAWAAPAAVAAPGASDGVQAAQGQQTDGNANVTVENQTSNGSVVVVSSVTLSDGGFVEVTDDNGVAVGNSSYLQPGVHSDVRVTLDSPLAANQTVTVFVLRDDGDRQYDGVAPGNDSDAPYRTENGSAVTADAVVAVTDGPAAADGTPADDNASNATANATGAAANATPAGNATPSGNATSGENVTAGNATNVTAGNATANATGNSTASSATGANTTGNATGTNATGNATGANATAANATTGNGSAAESDSFRVESFDAPASVAVGETVTVNATVRNPTDEAATQSVEFRVEGTLVERRSLSVDAGGTEEVTFTFDTTGLSAGGYVHAVHTRDFGQVTVVELTDGNATGNTTG